jgi:c(7)-type cytochrome triheme protein
MKRAFIFLIPFLAIAFFGDARDAGAQAGVKKRRPLPYEYGRVRIGTPYAQQNFPDAQFDHWIHRAKFTCRVCHVDIGFAMKANGSGIKAEEIMAGYYCGVCHNGKMDHEGRKVFGACAKTFTDEEKEQRCKRCHSAGEGGARKYNFLEFVKELPKERFGNGVNWMEAEAAGKVSPVDFVEGVSFKRKALEIPKDLDIEAKVPGMNEIVFSHKKHTVWNGCEGCHPEIFAGIKKGTTKYSMMEIFEGKYCGQCHTSVAFPMTDCQRCHTKPVQ